jgi:hypothetical protein
MQVDGVPMYVTGLKATDTVGVAWKSVYIRTVSSQERRRNE